MSQEDIGKLILSDLHIRLFPFRVVELIFK